jgi:hypothetical protein
MLSLRSFHLFFVILSIVLTSGVGAWALRHHDPALGAICLGIGALLVVYEGYFVRKAERLHLD